MTTATPELRRRWWPEDDPTGMETAQRFLQESGYKLLSNWHWLTPTPDHVITEDEDSAIVYLMMEWDYGGTVRQRTGHTPT